MLKSYKNLKFYFCVVTIDTVRKNFIRKICYKKKYKFLQLKNTPTYSLVNRISKKGNFLKIYKEIKKFHINYLLREKFYSIPLSSTFLFFYNKYYSFRDLDRILYWKFLQLDCMFINKTKIFKKKKKSLSKLLFLTEKNRTILCINILKNIILLNIKRRKKNITKFLFLSLYNYIVNDKNNLVLKVKYKLYKQKLIQLQE